MPADIKARPSGNDDARAKKMQELFSRIEAGVSGVFTSDNYRSYLRTMAKFHRPELPADSSSAARGNHGCRF